jgi:hypothetical protein
VSGGIYGHLGIILQGEVAVDKYDVIVRRGYWRCSLRVAKRDMDSAISWHSDSWTENGSVAQA